jgi:hypothetical protein
MSRPSVARILECRAKGHDEGRVAWCRSCDRFKYHPCDERGFYDHTRPSSEEFSKLVLREQEKRLERRK